MFLAMNEKRKKTPYLLLILIIGALIVGCGGGGSDNTANAGGDKQASAQSVSGIWVFQSFAGNGPATLIIDFTQNGNQLAGTSNSGNISGSVDGLKVTFNVPVLKIDPFTGGMGYTVYMYSGNLQQSGISITGIILDAAEGQVDTFIGTKTGESEHNGVVDDAGDYT